MFKSILVVGLLCAAAMPAVAQSEYPKAELGGGYSYLRMNIKATDSAVTPSVSVTESFDLQGGKGEGVFNATKSVGVVAEFGGYKVTGLPAGINANMYTYLFGPRVNFRGHEKLTPFVEGLFGAAHLSGSGSVAVQGAVAPGFVQQSFQFSGSSNSFAMALGGGIDYNLNRHIALRVIQADYLMTRFDTNINSAGNSSTGTQNNFRVGAGLQFRF